MDDMENFYKDLISLTCNIDCLVNFVVILKLFWTELNKNTRFENKNEWE